jgi:hypothetical protein
VAKKITLLQKVALVMIFVIPALLTLGLGYGILSDRGWAIGLMACFATALLLVAIMQKQVAKKNLAATSEPAIALDDRTRKRISRGIWISKVWISLLAVSLPFGIANGIAHCAWLPTLVGVGINLSMMYVAILEIRQRRKRLNGIRE